MRRIGLLLLALDACTAHAPSQATTCATASPKVAPAKVAAGPTPSLPFEAAPPAVSPGNVRFESPNVDQLLESAAADLVVRVASAALPDNALGIDVALDDERPHRLAPAMGSIPLRVLLRPELDLAAGEHWLFAAPVLDSGLVPKSAASAPPSAGARRFFVGTRGERPPDGGALWIRKPEGSYDGPGARRVLCDVLAFSAQGDALAAAPLLTLEHAELRARISASGPGFFSNLASGEYRVSATLAGTRSASLAFTVNAELGGPR